MSDYIVSLLVSTFWNLIFISSFFFGLIFLLFVLFTSMGHSVDKTLHAEGGSHEVATGDHDLSHGLDHDIGHSDNISSHAMDSGHEIRPISNFSSDHDLHIDNMEYVDGHIVTDQTGDISIVKDAIYIEKSNYTLGNIAVFLLIFGQIGWIFSTELTDLVLLIAIISGFIVSRLFAWILSNYAKTVIIPVQKISKGDIGTVVSGVSYEKLGIVHVSKKDGMITTILARGAYPHDNFIPGERGYIWEQEDDFYTITRGLEDQPDLNVTKQKKNKKKALDVMD